MPPPDRRFQAVLLDLFDTLVKWDPSRLPEMEIGGKVVHSTIPHLAPVLENALGPDFRLASFVDAYRHVLGEIETERDFSGIEITCRDRFRRTLARLGAPADGRDAGLADELTRVHMADVRSVTSAPPENVEVVLRLASRYRLGLLSNFDDAETGRAILADTGVADRFEVVVISAEQGFRKPHPEIFRRALSDLGREPYEVLFVGDNPHDDVCGARIAGVPVAWVKGARESFPADQPAPDFTIAALADLPALLGFP